MTSGGRQLTDWRATATGAMLRRRAALLDAAPAVVRPGGRVAVISFHSLEDRIVKRRFQAPPYRQTTKKPLQASPAEHERNPRARSAKLRVAIVLPASEEA